MSLENSTINSWIQERGGGTFKHGLITHILIAMITVLCSLNPSMADFFSSF